MPEMDLERLEKVEEGLALFFYFFMFVAFVAALDGSIGSGMLVLVAGSLIHVGRATVAELIDRERAREPLREVRPAAVVPFRSAPAGRERRTASTAAAIRRG